MTQKKVSVIFLSTLCIWLSIIIPSNAIPLNDFTGHSENLSSVVNFAVLPPGDPLPPPFWAITSIAFELFLSPQM
jgi:hypothetical protein